MTPLEALKNIRKAHPASSPESHRKGTMIPNGWTLFLLSTLFISAIGIGTTPGNLSAGYVFAFLAAVAGIVATGLTRTIAESHKR